MPGAPVFISHASSDNAFVRELRQVLEGLNIPVWVDSRNLRGGNTLAPAIAEVIAQARHVLVVLSPGTINSVWVRHEIRQALAIQKQRQVEGYRVIPLLLPGVETTLLALWFEEEPLAVPIALTVTGLSAALPAILAALGERSPDGMQPISAVAATQVEDLLLELRDPQLRMLDGKRQVTATATLTYIPAAMTARPVESRRFTFTAPLGPIEMDDLRWYLESFYLWPTGVFQERAARFEAQLPQWGEQLYKAVMATPSAQEALHTWQGVATGTERRFSVLVDSDLQEGIDLEAQAVAREAAIPLLAVAQQRCEALAAAGAVDANRMASVAITERADCLRDLGHLEAAAAAYEEAIQLDEARGAQRDIAVGKSQLGSVRLLQQRYDDALAAYQEARDLFTTLDEIGSVATIWHQIGMVHRQVGMVYRDTEQFRQAEHAYRQSLALKVQQQNRVGEAGTLDELGILYAVMGHLKEAVTLHRQAAERYASLGDLINEGKACNNLAVTLLVLQCYDDARRALQRAIACKEPFGHAAEPWTTWAILHNLERATGHTQAATAAWQQAVQCYLAYRREGGESQDSVALLCAHLADTIRQGDTVAVTQELAQLSAAPDTPPRLQALLPKLQAILHGDCNPALADDPALYYQDAAELRLLLETVGREKKEE